MFATKAECKECIAPLHSRSLSSQSFSAVALSFLPFLLTFITVSFVVAYRLLPLLAIQQHVKPSDEHYLPSVAPPSLRITQSNHEAKSLGRRIAAGSFIATMALATVLAELLLCEISNSLNPAARTLAMKITVSTLLFLLILLIPFLELRSLIKGIGWDFERSTEGVLPRTPWLLQCIGFATWLGCFWWLGENLPGAHIRQFTSQNIKSLSDACLERIGIIGISLMALLSGFASVSTPWQSFGVRSRPVTDSDISRKELGLDATNDMLADKRSRLRALHRKVGEGPAEKGFMKRMIGSLRSNTDEQEIHALHLEIAGLETMALSLDSSLSMLQTRQAASRRAATTIGRALIIPNSIFSLYCVYRIVATTVTSVQRWSGPTTSFATTDPINRFLGLLAKHWDPDLDQQAWSQQISFLLSGVMLMASFSSVLQTFHLLSRWAPALVHQAQANLPLIVGQISATYVISSALLLRSNLPSEVGTVISEALGAPLDTWFVERWFEGWFLLGALATAVGIWANKTFGRDGAWAGEEWDDFGGEIEMGQKRS